jgi:putative sigma-54 modulation protein
MQIEIHGRNLHVDQRLQEYVQKKLNKLDKYLPNIAAIHVDLAHERQHKGGERAIAQLTVRNSRGTVLRSEDKKQVDIFAAIDMAVDKMYRQISRYKGKQRRRNGERFESVEPELAAAEAVPIDVPEDNDAPGEILRRKELDLMPMSEDEAIDQMELLGHDFFMFYNASTDKINVLYHREDGGFGLLEPLAS